MNGLVQNEQSSTLGYIKARDLLYELSDEKNKQLSDEGINLEDIIDILLNLCSKR